MALEQGRLIREDLEQVAGLNLLLPLLFRTQSMGELLSRDLSLLWFLLYPHGRLDCNQLCKLSVKVTRCLVRGLDLMFRSHYLLQTLQELLSQGFVDADRVALLLIRCV